MNNRNHCSVVVIHNITRLSTREIEKYCEQYEKDLRSYRRKNRNNHEYIHIAFSSMISANQFLNDRPHFIKNCRINTSSLSDPLSGPNFVCVQVGRNTSITEDSLYEYASRKFGRVLNCVLYNLRGYAFIEFHQLVDAQRALEAPVQQFNGHFIQFCSRHSSSRISPLLSFTRLVHIGNFRPKDQSNLQVHFPNLQNLTTHYNCYGQVYILGLFHINESIQVLLRRAFCLNGRVLNIFIDNDDQLTECDNYLLARHVPSRLNDYNLLEYFSQFGRVLNCYRYGHTDAYRIQYRDRTSLNQVLDFNRIHVVKSIPLQIQHERN